MIKRNIVLIGLALASICAARVYAHSPTGTPGMGHPHMMGGGPGRLIPALLRATDLTPDQKTQVHQILDADHQAVQPVFGQLKQANDALANQLLGPQDVQADALATQLANIAQLQQQLAQHEAATIVKIRAVLTPDQLAKALAAKDQMPGRHHHQAGCTKNGN